MKFWELHSVARQSGQAHPLQAVAKLNPEWLDFAQWSENFAAIVDAQDRTVLDKEVPDALCRAVLAELNLPFYQSDGMLRSYRSSRRDDELSALDAYDRFGGWALEEAQEKGSCLIGDAK